MSFRLYMYYHQKKFKKWNKTKNICTRSLHGVRNQPVPGNRGRCFCRGSPKPRRAAGQGHLKSPDMHLQSSGNKVGWALGIAGQAPRKASANSYRRAGDRNERNFLPLWWRIVPSPPTSTCSRRTKAFPARELPVRPGNPAPPFSLEDSEQRKAGRWRPPPVTERPGFSPSD